jgi:ribonucleoside-diphosphate reductase alpha chain
MESFSVFNTKMHHTCNLLSLVHPYIKEDELEYVVRSSIDLLNLTVDISEAPVKKSAIHNDLVRAIGLGSMGLDDWRAWNGYSWLTDIGLINIEERFEKIAYYAIDQSADLSKRYGSFKLFDESEWAKGNMLGKTLDEIQANSRTNLDWNFLSNKVKNGMANGWLLAIAPNTTSSSAIGVTSSILPTYAKLFLEETKVGNIARMPLYIGERPLSYIEYKNIDMFRMNTIIGRIQFWTDAGISYEPIFDLNDPENRKARKIANFYIDAWKKGVKGVYYIRWVKPGTTDITSKKECIGCAG